MTAGSPVRDTVRAYYGARFNGDAAAAAALIGEGFAFSGPFLTSDSPHGHLDGLEGLLGTVTGVELISDLYGEGEQVPPRLPSTPRPEARRSPPADSWAGPQEMRAT